MQWYDELYMGERVEKNIEKIKWKAEHRAGMVSVYFITLASNEENLLDIVHSAMYLQPALYRDNPYVVGVAYGYENAVDLTIEILMDVYRKTGGFRVREYILR